MTTFAIIGFGEVGAIFARDLHAAGASAIAAFDTDERARARAEACGYVEVRNTAAEAAEAADVVFVAVTAGSALAAAGSLSGGLGRAPFVVDVNSVSPATKQAAARAVSAAGGRLVEAAVMTSVPPHGLRSPMLLGGPDAESFAEVAGPLGMRAKVFSARIGGASSVKMCRSVMIKGLEALATECLLTARHYGVEREVLLSLSDTLPHEDWPGLARYVIGRALLHGKRRAEEMREVARTVSEAGVEPLLSRAIAERQDWAAERGREMGRDGVAAPDLGALLDALSATLDGRAARPEARGRLEGADRGRVAPGGGRLRRGGLRRARARRRPHAGHGPHRHPRREPGALPEAPLRPAGELRAHQRHRQRPQHARRPPDVPARTLAELVAYAKTNPGRLNYATGGIGSAAHIATVALADRAGIGMTHVPYRGTAPAVTDLLGGRVQLTFTGAPNLLQHVEAGKMRALAVSGLSRLKSAPTVPTVAEFGFDGFEASQWYGILAPAGTPKAIVERLNAEIVAAMAAPEIAERLSREGAEVWTNKPAEFRDHIAREMARWGDLVRRAGIKPE